MKIRTDFVTNSSSSSFLCEVCGHMESGMDMSLNDAEMVECTHGHVMCKDHVNYDIDEKDRAISSINSEIKKYERYSKNSSSSYYADRLKEFKDLLAKVENSDEDIDLDLIYEEHDMGNEIPAVMCPICQFKRLKNSDSSTYLMKKYNINEEDLKKEIQSSFGNYEEFEKYLEE